MCRLAVGLRFLVSAGIPIRADDLGRDAVTREAVGRLLEEKRANELRAAALRKVAEAEAIAADEAFRASLPRGRAWYDMPAGESVASVMLEEAKAEQPRRMPSYGEWFFDGKGESTGGTFGPGSEWQ